MSEPAAKQICVIDDDASLRRAIVNLMRPLGHNGTAYPTAEAFLASGDAAHCDCLITDIYMPGLNGLELLKRLRDGGFSKPAIVITAVPENGLDDRARALGACCVLYKPFDGNTLVDCVDRALARP